MDSDDGPVAFGADGSHRLRDGVVEGIDPLLPYGPHARADLLRHQAAAHVGDLVLISSVDPVTEEVAAFEELVGSHGGLGGWQTDAMLVHPADWPVTQGDLNGSDAIHRQLVEWLAMLGLRTQPAAADELAAIEAGEPIRIEDFEGTTGDRTARRRAFPSGTVKGATVGPKLEIMTEPRSAGPTVTSQAVLSPLTDAAIFLVATVRDGGEQQVRDLLEDLSGLQRSVGFRLPAAQLSCVTGIGSRLWDRLVHRAKTGPAAPVPAVEGPQAHRALDPR